MNRHGPTHRWLAALLSAVLLLGGVLPGLQRVCAEMTLPQQAAMQVEATAVSHAHASSHECEDDCSGSACCVSVSSFTESLDLRLPDRGGAVDVQRLRTVASVSVPAPTWEASGWVRDVDSGLRSSVRLHVWTATFLS